MYPKELATKMYGIGANVMSLETTIEKVLEKVTEDTARRATQPSTATSSSPGKSFGFGFSTLNKPKVNAVILPSGSDDYVSLIEASNNFSKAFNLAHSPREYILQGKINSVVFKVSESHLKQIVTYHFWKKSYSEPDYYIIMVSTKDRQVDFIGYKEEGSIPTKFFKITDDNTVDIIEYSSPRL